MSTLIAVVFHDESTAFEMRAALAKMQRQYLLEMDDAVVVTRDIKGKIKLQQAVSLTAAGAASGAFWGMLVGLLFFTPLLGLAVGAGAGALSGKLSDLGIDNTMAKQLGDELTPGSSASIVLLRRLRHLSAKLMRVQDEERRRFARNLHDSLGQYLANVKMNLDMLSRSATTKQMELLSAALESVERSIVETRTLSFLLHPPLLEEVGFASAARWYADEFAKRSKIEVKLNLPDDGIDRLPQSVEIALFRILQESLTNVHRHSGSSSVEISLSSTQKEAVLSVRDFGRGMPPELMQGSDLNDSFVGVGLSGMRERVTDLGGSFSIESNSHGTAIIVALPTEEHSAKARPSQANLVKKSAA